MAYIGQSIKNGTFTVLDTSGNTYNGSNTTFSLGTQVGSAAQLLVSHDGVIQKPGTDFTLATGGTQITFTTAPASGAAIFIVEISGAVGGTITPSDDSVTTSKIADSAVTNAKITDGTIANAKLANSSITLNGSAVSLGGSATIGGGKVLQVVQAVKSDISTLTGNGNYQDISGLSVSITPSATSSKIFVQCLLSLGTTTNTYAQAQFVRDSTAINLGDTSGSRPRGTFSLSDGGSGAYYYTVSRGANFLDSPNSTSGLTYKVQAQSGSGVTLTFNTSGEGYSGSHAVTSSITVMEIGA